MAQPTRPPRSDLFESALRLLGEVLRHNEMSDEDLIDYIASINDQLDPKGTLQPDLPTITAPVLPIDQLTSELRDFLSSTPPSSPDFDRLDPYESNDPEAYLISACWTAGFSHQDFLDLAGIIEKIVATDAVFHIQFANDRDVRVLIQFPSPGDVDMIALLGKIIDEQTSIDASRKSAELLETTAAKVVAYETIVRLYDRYLADKKRTEA